MTFTVVNRVPQHYVQFLNTLTENVAPYQLNKGYTFDEIQSVIDFSCVPADTARNTLDSMKQTLIFLSAESELNEQLELFTSFVCKYVYELYDQTQQLSKDISFDMWISGLFYDYTAEYDLFEVRVPPSNKMDPLQIKVDYEQLLSRLQAVKILNKQHTGQYQLRLFFQIGSFRFKIDFYLLLVPINLETQTQLNFIFLKQLIEQKTVSTAQNFYLQLKSSLQNHSSFIYNLISKSNCLENVSKLNGKRNEISTVFNQDRFVFELQNDIYSKQYKEERIHYEQEFDKKITLLRKMQIDQIEQKYAEWKQNVKDEEKLMKTQLTESKNKIEQKTINANDGREQTLDEILKQDNVRKVYIQQIEGQTFTQNDLDEINNERIQTSVKKLNFKCSNINNYQPEEKLNLVKEQQQLQQKLAYKLDKVKHMEKGQLDKTMQPKTQKIVENALKPVQNEELTIYENKNGIKMLIETNNIRDFRHVQCKSLFEIDNYSQDVRGLQNRLKMLHLYIAQDNDWTGILRNETIFIVKSETLGKWISKIEEEYISR
ncbi:Hypothetical_protein [Hexamita inflata]|uniref:Hypothetical_protein n=1 Tax=Hexamita inflata TaxID=28002 RepID=A0AA86Q3T2_9EUKA|nr:Hypothetical protein HINF_LOCUS32724 [Hexamita inflata]